MILLSDIDVLVRAGESYTVEFKTSFNRETIESLVAFANAQGGTVLIGIADDGSVCGVTIGPDGHLKIPHLWPGQNPPPQCRQNGC
jgi:ATP-dependent DNA helicase RecG